MKSSDISRLKNALRLEARKRRKALGCNSEWTLPRCHRLPELFNHDLPIASYCPVGSEANPAAMELLASQMGAIICFPRIDADAMMRFYALGPSGAFVRNPLGFDEPSPDAVPSAPAIVMVPLLAFDRAGTRLGQGGGHYDRALAALPNVLKVGVAWSVQEMEDLPREPWDIPLDIVITEREWIVTS